MADISRRGTGGMFALRKDDDGVYRLRRPPGGVRIGVIGKTANPVDYGTGGPGVRERERELLAAVTGITPERIVSLNQVHEDEILLAEGPLATGNLAAGDADGLVTAFPGLCLVIRTADCVPVFAYDPEGRVLGAAHSGWRGARLEIAGKLVREMKRLAGARSRDILVFVLPSIGPESYTVGSDVADFFPGHTSEKDGVIRLDLWKSVETSLVREGIPAGNIFNAGICTLGAHGEFFSHRGGDAGRNLNFGYMTP